MELLLTLSQDLESRLRSETERLGVDARVYVLHLLETTLPHVTIPDGLAGLRHILSQIGSPVMNGDAFKPHAPALEHLLAGIEKADMIALTEDERHRLYGLLDIYFALVHPDSLIEILRLIERAEDFEAIPSLRSLAASIAVSPNSLRVRQEARSLLAKLTRRAEQLRQGKILLRPAVTPAGILLRPAQGVPQADATLLLRPSAPQEEGRE